MFKIFEPNKIFLITSKITKYILFLKTKLPTDNKAINEKIPSDIQAEGT